MKGTRLMAVAIAVAILSIGSSAVAYSQNSYGALTRGDVVYSFLEWRDEINDVDVFSDVDGEFYADAANWALQRNLSTGVSEGIFDGNRPITRAELSVLAARFVEMKGCELSPGTISEYPDAAEVPAWAYEAMALLISNNIVCASEGYLNPRGIVTKSELTDILLSLDSYINPRDFLPNPENADYKTHTLTQVGGGKEVYLGMSLDASAENLGIHEKNWWTTSSDTVAATIARNMLTLVSIKDNNWWIVDETILVGTGKETVDSVFGDSLTMNGSGHTIPKGITVYRYDKRGVEIDESGEFAYMVAFTYDHKDTLTEIVLTTADLFSEPTTAISKLPRVQGAISFYASGHGDDSVTVAQEGMYCFELTHSGTGEFIITDCCDKELFRNSGGFSGRVILDGISETGQLNIKADGNWTVTAIDNFGILSIPTSGNGNYVIAGMLSVQAAQAMGMSQLRFIHSGEGRFIVRQVLGNPNVKKDEVNYQILASGFGEYDKCFEFPPQGSFVPFIEIIADGSWAILYE